MKILLATDGSEYSQAAVEDVSRRLFPQDTNVRIISAYEITPLITPFGAMGEMQQYSAESNQYALHGAEKATENAEQILRKKHPELTITTIVIEGSPKTVILREAETFGADLIVVGSHGYGFVERFLMGSVSHAVSLHAKCSVEVVRKQNFKN